METLPLLVLESICEHLAYDKSHEHSLSAFASTSRVCHTAARRERFFQVSIDVDDEQYFHQRLARLERMLDEARARSCVRVLKLGTHTVFQARGEDDRTEEAWLTSTRSLRKFHEAWVWELRTDSRASEWWGPLVRFISSFHLKDLFWNSAEQIPRCILSVLNKHVPRCRLHVQAFDLRSLHQRTILQNIDDAEYELASSPSLHSIISPYSVFDATGCANYNGEATLRLVAELAHNLKHVWVWDNTLRGSGDRRPGRSTRQLAWRGFRPQSDNVWCEVPRTKGQLQSLRIDPDSALTGSQLATWELHTNFSVLKSLKIADGIKLEALHILDGLVERDGICSLRALELPAVLCDFEDRRNAESMMTRLLLSLKPLVELSVVGVQDSSFDAVLQRHGNSLQACHIEDFILSPQQVKQMRESLPRVKDLSIELLRSAGDKVEIEAYKALGSMRNLESLSIGLQCTDYRYDRDDPEGYCLLMGPCSHFQDEEEQEAMKVSIRQVLINAAVDESLARSIFRTISEAHTSAKPGLQPKLNSIRLRVDGAPELNNQSMNHNFQGVLAWIGRSWRYKRDPRDTHQNDFTVEEVNSDARKRKANELEVDMDDFPDSEQYASIWSSLWPKTGTGWREEWRSFPLVGCSASTETVMSEYSP